VAQIDDKWLETTMADGRYLDHTRVVLQNHGALQFQNESSVISANVSPRSVNLAMRSARQRLEIG
jgi:hypothetical protein